MPPEPISIQQAIELTEQGRLSEIMALPREAQLRLAEEVLRTKATLRQESQLYFYQPVSAEARKIHLSTAKVIYASGGNRSSKSDSCLAELSIQLTGIVPFCLKDVYPKEKIRPPIKARLICSSLINVWETALKPKLQWNRWNGRGDPGGPWGHWGWIPRSMLIKGRWEESWSASTRVLTLNNNSTLQVMSTDQDLENFVGDSLHAIMIDEGCGESLYRENRIRTMDVGGRLMIGYTPPDETGAAWEAAWMYNQIYERGLPGPTKDPEVDSFTLFTEDNRMLDPVEIKKISDGLTDEQRETRLHGRFMHLSGLIYPIFTSQPAVWCFQCKKKAFVVNGLCSKCQGDNLAEYCHEIEPFDTAYTYPIVYMLDPHPRKPYMMMWIAVGPMDDAFQIAEMECDLEPVELRDKVFELEGDLGLHVMKRVMDPNMAESPAHAAGRRHVTVRDELDAVGLRCDLADDSFAPGKTRLTQMLTPDPLTLKPQAHVFSSCQGTISQFKKFSWDEWSSRMGSHKDPKPQAKEKFSDYPTLWRYFALGNHTFRWLKSTLMSPSRRKRTGAYG